jgi:hypothetical protein
MKVAIIGLGDIVWYRVHPLETHFSASLSMDP